MNPVSYVMVSLGCAKNLVNSEQMAYLLQQEGYRSVEDPYQADIAIVNTCGFIDSAASEAIEKILELDECREKGRLKKILVTGCLAQRYGEQILDEMPEVDGILGTGSYDDIADAVKAMLEGKDVVEFGDIDAPVSETARVVSTPPYTAYIKIAEGCDNRCSYCVIPSLRGKYRSRSMEALVEEAKLLASNGVKELIVVAQDITRYGLDLYGKRCLDKLVKQFCAIDGIEWVRLHYLYPDQFSDELIDVIANEEKVVKYLDIPIQHINNGILKAMNRRGTKEDIITLLNKLRSRIDGLVIRTSLICGLPGEGDEEFEELCEFLRQARIERVGVFPFSPQEGTAAAKMEGAAEESVVNNRVNLIIDLQSDIMDEYNESRIGEEIRVLCEGTDLETGKYCGRTYADSPDIDGRVLFISEQQLSAGDMPMVYIDGTSDGDLLGHTM